MFGKNPRLSEIAQASPSAIAKVESDVIMEHFRALKTAREAFLKSESCERIRQALAHKIRASEEKYYPGDEVYYKREHNAVWLGPGKVVFQDGKVVFIRHGSSYVRASVNKIIRKGTELNAEKDVKDLPSPEKKEEETTKLSRVEESFDEVDNQPCQEQVTIEEATVI